jgi:hypothetical protein
MRQPVTRPRGRVVVLAVRGPGKRVRAVWNNGRALVDETEFDILHEELHCLGAEHGREPISPHPPIRAVREQRLHSPDRMRRRLHLGQIVRMDCDDAHFE